MTKLFDRDALVDVLTDIETYLGYLKGNELAYDYLNRAVLESSGTQVGDDEELVEVQLPADWKFPCPEVRFAVSPPQGFKTLRVHVSGEQDARAAAERWAKQVQEGTELAYQGGLGWASGFASYASTLCEQITKPSAYALDSEARMIKTSVVEELGSLKETDWGGLKSLLDDWEGNANDAFEDFYEALDGKLAVFVAYTGFLYAGICAMTKIVDGAQTGLVKYVDSARDAVVEQLNAWVEQGMPPRDYIKTPAWLADLGQLAMDTLPFFAMVPGLSVITGAISGAQEKAGQLATIAADLGVEPPHDEPDFHAKDCASLYDEITGALRKLTNDYNDALDSVATGELPGDRQLDGATAYNPGNIMRQLEIQTTRSSWNIDPVNSQSVIATDDPDHDTNHDGVDDRAEYD
jgi:hypothetical protein